MASNGGKETAVVTQCGCREGERFEGYDMRARGKPKGPTVAAMQQEGDWVGNGSDPMAGSRVKQTCRAICGANHRSWEERQGWKTHLTWQSDADGRTLVREDDLDRTQMATKRWRGVLWKTTREEVR